MRYRLPAGICAEFAGLIYRFPDADIRERFGRGIGFQPVAMYAQSATDRLPQAAHVRQLVSLGAAA